MRVHAGAGGEILRAQDLTPGPGVHAHLGLLYSHAGRDEAALREFNTEKALYPESAPFLDGLLARAQMAQQQKGAAR